MVARSAPRLWTRSGGRWILRSQSRRLHTVRPYRPHPRSFDFPLAVPFPSPLGATTRQLSPRCSTRAPHFVPDHQPHLFERSKGARTASRRSSIAPPGRRPFDFPTARITGRREHDRSNIIRPIIRLTGIAWQPADLSGTIYFCATPVFRATAIRHWRVSTHCGHSVSGSNSRHFIGRRRVPHCDQPGSSALISC